MANEISVDVLIERLRENTRGFWPVARYCIRVLGPNDTVVELASKSGLAFADGWHLTAEELPDDSITVLGYSPGDDRYSVVFWHSEEGMWMDAYMVAAVPAPKWWTDLPWAPE
jgi:hypothetical protein